MNFLTFTTSIKTLKNYFKYLLLTCTFFYATKNYCQTYFPFPQDSALWCIWIAYASPSSSGIRQISFEINSDTILNDLLYKNVLTIKRYSAICCDSGSNYINDDYVDDTIGYIGALRFEEEKVYFYKYEEDFGYPEIFCPANTEVLLYDFGLQVGDSAYFEFTESSFTGYHKVIYIDSILLLDGFYHKIIGLELEGGLWIQGVGSEMGLFGTYFMSTLGGD